MTQDYKDILLKYITNNLSKEEGVNIPEFSNVISESATDLYYELEDAFEYGYRQNGVVQCKNVDGEYNGFILVYGMYWTDEDKTDSLAKGYMLLFDNNFELVQIIKKYKSGTDCGIFMKVVVNNDGTLIALDHFDNRNRFLMLNNPSVKLPSAQNYSLVLRSSYNLQGDVENISYTMKGNAYVLDKDPNSANYMIGATDINDGFEGLTQLKINVGTANTWTDYIYTKLQIAQQNYQNIVHVSIYWQEEKPYMSIYNNLISYSTYTNTYIYYFARQYNINGGLETDGLETIWDNYDEPSSENIYAGSNVIPISSDNLYYVWCYGYNDYDEDTTETHIEIWHWKKNGNKVSRKKVYDYQYIQESTTGVVGASVDTEVYNLNGTIFVYWCGIYQRLASYTTMTNNAILITNNDDYASVVLGSPDYNEYNQFHITTIINQFDLYKVFAMFNDFDSGWRLNRSDIIYNYLYYNGPAYENVNALKANQGMLYDVNGNIFVRGVYNHIVNDNITEDTIQIPNTMVNDIQITQNKLLSQTNQPMVINNETIEKNIYETLYINYFNEINIENRNTATTISNKDAAIRLNYTISDELDYDSATITKYRINYHDGTSLINNVDDIIIDEGVATITIHFYVDKQIDSIDLLSNDEETYYQRITSNLNIGSLYTLTQECYVD